MYESDAFKYVDACSGMRIGRFCACYSTCVREDGGDAIRVGFCVDVDYESFNDE